MIPTTPDLAELRRLAEAATPGPWRTEYLMGAGNDLLTAIIAGRATPDDLRVIGSTLAERDGKFIAAAVNALPGLLDELDELRAEVCVRRDARKALAHMREARDNARAWDEGGDFVTRHPGMSAEYVRAANPYRQPEGNRDV